MAFVITAIKNENTHRLSLNSFFLTQKSYNYYYYIKSALLSNMDFDVEDEDYHFSWVVCVIGSEGVGKSSLISAFLKDQPEGVAGREVKSEIQSGRSTSALSAGVTATPASKAHLSSVIVREKIFVHQLSPTQQHLFRKGIKSQFMPSFLSQQTGSSSSSTRETPKLGKGECHIHKVFYWEISLAHKGLNPESLLCGKAALISVFDGEWDRCSRSSFFSSPLLTHRPYLSAQ